MCSAALALNFFVLVWMPYVPQTVVTVMRSTGTAGVTCSSAGSDTFSSDPLTSGDWNVDLNEDATGFVYDGTNQEITCTTGGSGDYNSMTYTKTAASSSDMWAKVEYSTFTSNNALMGLVIRRSTSGGARYAFMFTGSGGEFAWYYWDGVGTNAPQQIAQVLDCNDWAAGDTVGVSVTGTGDNTEVKIWRNPSGDDPDDWGTPCDSDSTNTVYNVDSGTYGGLFCRASTSTVRTMG